MRIAVGIAVTACALLPLRAATVFDSIGQEVTALFEKAKPAIVRVRSEGESLRVAGTGFFIDEKGTVLTAAPILGQSDVVTVEFNGKVFEANVLGRDTRSSVALLKINAGMTPALGMTESNGLKAGSSVVTIGYPLNLPAAPSFGIVAGFDFRYLGRIFPTTHIRANVPIGPGQVGGPLLNTQGQVIGLVVTAVDEGRGVYALPTEAVQKILGDFTHYKGTARHGWVGVGVVETTPGTNISDGTGVKISQLFPGTPAAASGLASGDIVLKIDGREIKKPADVIDASFFCRVGEELPVTVMRGGKQMTYRFRVQERPRTNAALPLANPPAPKLQGPVQISAPGA